MNSEDMAGIVACLSVMIVPVIWILTAHQRKMALIIHGAHREQAASTSNNDALAAEVRDLKQLVYQQAIAVDMMSTKLDNALASGIQNRLSGSQH
jgi:hypothetical protein